MDSKQTDSVQADQSDLQCSNCAGQCVWSAVDQALACASCGTLHPMETDTDHLSWVEHPYGPDMPEHDAPVLSVERPYQCQSCGGEILFTGATLSERCPYCDGSVVLGTADTGYRTKALIPFQADEKFAQKQVHKWIKGRFGAPNDLAGIVAKGRVAGLYAPFWTFDSREVVKYWAKYKSGSGDNRRTRKTSGSMSVHFDDLLMPASDHVTPLIRDGILHDFNPQALRPYRAGYLSGFAAERHHQSVAQGLRANEPDKKLLIRNRIKQHINKSAVHDIRYETDTTGIHYRRILLPVWVLHYSYNGKPMKVVVSGIDGRTFGERPLSLWKVAGFSAVLSTITLCIGVAWGALGLL